ncbi:LURP-one-related/scramblase family protein [Liquorilactobacillus vini]|uniref:Uncharacterized protein n=1 Tax=Liquorilactobacillus vini DSM 20605 TaxID=1133569 RepID=A0A0R2CAA8_9LACO|nr:hypothetical protein [Liquorilactobacillus vini]KRM88799.1 hypothetical protein FD21_GL000813 [Liquorilactobacillus vini DSM 20605]
MRTLYARKYRMSHQGATTITDKNFATVYLVVGKWGRHGDVLSVYAISGELLAEIRQVGFGIFPRFNLYFKHHFIGKLRRYHFGKKDLLVVKELNWFVVGDIYSLNYRIFKGRTQIMQLNEVLLANGRFLQLKIDSIHHEPICLCIVAILNYFAQKPVGKVKKIYEINFNFD